MEHTEEIILDIIKLMELDEDMIDICEDNHGNISIVERGMSQIPIRKALKENNHE